MLRGSSTACSALEKLLRGCPAAVTHTSAPARSELLGDAEPSPVPAVALVTGSPRSGQAQGSARTAGERLDLGGCAVGEGDADSQSHHTWNSKPSTARWSSAESGWTRRSERSFPTETVVCVRSRFCAVAFQPHGSVDAPGLGGAGCPKPQRQQLVLPEHAHVSCAACQRSGGRGEVLVRAGTTTAETVTSCVFHFYGIISVGRDPRGHPVQP